MIELSKTKRILIYSNTYEQKDVKKHSGLYVIANTIKFLNELRDDLWFYVVMPKETDLLEIPNVTQLVMARPRMPNSFRGEFQVKKFRDLTKYHEMDIDLVYTHQPEHNLNIVNTMRNTTNFNDVPMLGYSHWFEVPENTNYSSTYLPYTIAGVLQCEKLGVNSEWLKNHVIESVRDMYSEKTLDRLDEIIEPHYLGVDMNEHLPFKKQKGKKSILFNHKSHAFMGSKFFVECMDELWAKRQDFDVKFTQMKVDRPYADNNFGASDRKDYLKNVNKCAFGVGCFTSYSAWSVAVTDGFLAGIPWILPNGLVYPEMVGENYKGFYTTGNKESFIEAIEAMLDSEKHRKAVYDSFDMEPFDWMNRIKKINDVINDILANRKEITDKSERIHEIFAYIKQQKVVTKKDILSFLGWGKGIGFTHYRNRIMNHPNIFSTNEAESKYVWVAKGQQKKVTAALNKGDSFDDDVFE